VHRIGVRGPRGGTPAAGRPPGILTAGAAKRGTVNFKALDVVVLNNEVPAHGLKPVTSVQSLRSMGRTPYKSSS
jgi:hypothetical protein